MSGFRVPQMDQVDREAKALPSEGRHDVTITSIECTRSSKGDPMMVVTQTIDNGPDAGHKIKEYFAFSDTNTIAWSRLACLCDAAGFEWEEASSLEAFAAQFPLNEMRFSVEIEYSYSVLAYLDEDDKYRYNSKAPMKDSEHPFEHWVEVDEEEWEEWPTEDKSKRAQVRSGFDFQTIYQPAESEAELEFGEKEAVPAGNGQAEEDGFEPDDDLPF